MSVTLHDGYLVKLNEKDHTASILKCLNSYKAIHIPRTIIHKSKEYHIIKIEENAFKYSSNPKVITFSCTSDLKFISKNAFTHSGVQKIILPKKIQNLEEGWCKSTNCLYYLIAPINNKHITYVNDSLLICNDLKKYKKNDEENDDDFYDDENTLIFARRDIEITTIPSYVKRIGESAFENCEKLRSVTFENLTFSEKEPDTSNSSSLLEEIGNNAFAYCKNLEKISFIPRNIKRIGQMSFAYCSKLSTLEMSRDCQLRIISRDAFFHSSLKELFIPSSLEYFEEGWCRDTNDLTNIKLSPTNEHFKYIDDQLLMTKYEHNSKECFILNFARRDIESVVIPSNVKKIASCAFYGCAKLTTVSFSPSSTVFDEIGENAFSQCLMLENVVSIPPTIKTIRRLAFESCKNLKIIEFTQNCELQTIEHDAFKESSISKLFLSKSVENIEEGWCNGMGMLVDLEIDQENKNYDYLDNKYLINKKSVLLFARRDIDLAVLPPNIKRIGKSAFSGCKKLKTLDFSQNEEFGLQEIGESAFSNCSELELNLVFPSSIKRIEESAFSSCNKLESISFSLSCILEEIGDYSFYYCSRIKQIDSIPSTTKRIGKNAFRCLRALKNVTFSKSSQSSLIEIDDKAFDYCRQMISITGIPSSIKRIGHSAFENCVSLKEIIFEMNDTETVETETETDTSNSSSLLEEIGNNAFAYCKNLEKISFIPRNIKRIGQMSFAYCSKLSTLEMSRDCQLRIISRDAFFHSSLKELFIPSSLEYFEEGWCRDTNDLTNIKLSPTNEHFKYIDDQLLMTKYEHNSQYYDYSSNTNPDEIENESFKQPESSSIYEKTDSDFVGPDEEFILLFARRDIKKVVVPSCVRRISQCAFQGCSKMKSLVFEPSLTVIDYIGDSAFSYCSSLESIELVTNRIRKIGKFAFFLCKKLRKVSFVNSKDVDLPDILEEIGEDAFDFCENLELVSAVPDSVKIVGKECFRPLKKIYCVEFLSDEISLGDLGFGGCKGLSMASFPNGKKVSLGYRCFFEVSPDFILLIGANCELVSQNLPRPKK